MSIDLHHSSFDFDTWHQTHPTDMNKLCRQVSIESPSPAMKDCVFNFIVPVPDTPARGARILVVCAGACYRLRRSPSISSVSSISSDLNDLAFQMQSGQPMPQSSSPAHSGMRDGALFPGFEVAGVIESLGTELQPDCGFHVGQRIVLYPYEDVPAGYSELIVVPELKYLIPIPDILPLSVAAMLPTGALLAMNAVYSAHRILEKILEKRGPQSKCKILIVGTGGLALWAVRIAAQYFQRKSVDERVDITVASLRDEGIRLAKECGHVTIVQWNEDLYEKQLIERTHDACDGLVDVVIDFGTTSRSLHRSMQCLIKGGSVLVSEEVAEKLLPKFSRKAEEMEQRITAVANGTIEQLHELVNLVSTNEIEPPPHSVFPCEQASEVVKKLLCSEIPGRAILRFHDIE